MPLLFIPWDNTYHSRSLKLIWNCGHLPLFACLAVLFTHYASGLRRRAYEAQVALLALLVILIGTAIEVIQLHIGRDFSLNDVALDVIGACIVPAVRPPSRRVLWRFSPSLLRLTVLATLLATLYPLAVSLVDEYRARRQFPVLARFESRLELGRLGGGAALQFTGDGVSVRFGTERYSGFSLKYFPRNWAGYRYLDIEIRNPGTDAVDLTCRIHDQFHDQSYEDRYNRRFTLEPGPQTIRVDLQEVAASPRTRTMDMRMIGGLGCFTISLPSPVTLILRKIVLRNLREPVMDDTVGSVSR